MRSQLRSRLPFHQKKKKWKKKKNDVQIERFAWLDMHVYMPIIIERRRREHPQLNLTMSIAQHACMYLSMSLVPCRLVRGLLSIWPAKDSTRTRGWRVPKSVWMPAYLPTYLLIESNNTSAPRSCSYTSRHFIHLPIGTATWATSTSIQG